jgi:hypothetical protein
MNRLNKLKSMYMNFVLQIVQATTGGIYSAERRHRFMEVYLQEFFLEWGDEIEMW